MGDTVCSDGEEVMLRMFVGVGVIVWAGAGCDSVFLKREMAQDYNSSSALSLFPLYDLGQVPSPA